MALNFEKNPKELRNIKINRFIALKGFCEWEKKIFESLSVIFWGEISNLELFRGKRKFFRGKVRLFRGKFFKGNIFFFSEEFL